MLELTERRRRSEWDDLVSRMQFQLVGLDQHTQSSQSSSRKITEFSNDPRSLDTIDEVEKRGIMDEEIGCTQMDTPVKPGKRRYDATLDLESTSTSLPPDISKRRCDTLDDEASTSPQTDSYKKPYQNMPNTQVADVDYDSKSDDEATQNERPCKVTEQSVFDNDDDDDDETQAELRCTRRVAPLVEDEIVAKSLSHDAQIESTPALSLELDKQATDD
jgi:hypothetical protein